MLPAKGPARDAYILQAVRENRAEITWTEVTSSIPGHTATFIVMADALKVDGVRVGVSAYLQQQIADLLGAMLLTPKIADLLYAQADIVLFPHPISEWRGVNASCSSATEDMIEHSRRIDQDLQGEDLEGKKIATVGKHWGISNLLLNKPGRALNHGWHLPGTSPTWKGIKLDPWATMEKDPKTGLYRRMIQRLGTWHDPEHDDYSQTVVIMSRLCTTDGNPDRVPRVLGDHTLAGLASHEGVLKILRQPGVPELPPLSGVSW